MDQTQSLLFSVKPTKDLDSKEKNHLIRLFELTYDQANPAYIEKSILTLKFIAMAKEEKTLVGFAVADSIKTDLPRCEEQQVVLLAGISCVHPEFRRRGLFRSLETLAANASGLITPGNRILACGRMAHPASFRVLKHLPSVIPKPGIALSDWHKEMGLKIAGLYGVSFDPDTFVVKGSGTPIGFPRLKFDVEEEEWLPFVHVNRNHGDSLLGMAWVPAPPEGW